MEFSIDNSFSAARHANSSAKIPGPISTLEVLVLLAYDYNICPKTMSGYLVFFHLIFPIPRSSILID